MERIEVERWKDIAGWEDVYQISNQGRIKSFKKNDKGIILSVKNKTGWYLSATLFLTRLERESRRIHRLVAEAFIPNPLNKPEINHKDGNKQKNYVENLEWCTHLENMRHSFVMGLGSFKEMNHYNAHVRPLVVQQYTLGNKFISKFINCKEASKATGVCHRNIHQVAARTEYKPGLTRKQAGGFVWRFKDERD